MGNTIVGSNPTSSANLGHDMKFADIKKFTPSPGYAVHVDWKYLEPHLVEWGQEKNNELGPNAGVDLDPDFQRAHVWTEQQQVAYVEYILHGGVSGRDIYFNCKGWGRGYEGPFVLVDGKQRLEAVRKFLRDELTIFKDLRHPQGYAASGVKFSDFTDRLPFQAMFIFHVNDLKKRADVLRWYLEMNTGGTVHSSEEISKVQRMLESAK